MLDEMAKSQESEAVNDLVSVFQVVAKWTLADGQDCSQSLSQASVDDPDWEPCALMAQARFCEERVPNPKGSCAPMGQPERLRRVYSHKQLYL